MALELLHGADGQPRCGWCGSDALYQAYHDHEWGMPVDDDRRLFEKLCLESFQAGLSWLTILRKRPAFRAAFAACDGAFKQASRFDGWVDGSAGDSYLHPFTTPPAVPTPSTRAAARSSSRGSIAG